MTRSQVIATDLSNLFRARNPLIWIVTREEARVEGYLFEAAISANYVPRTWDVAAGVCNLNGTRAADIGANDPDATLDAIAERAGRKTDRGVWIMRDLPTWLVGPSGATTLRKVRNLARMLPGVPRDGSQAMVVLSPSADVPAELANHATVIEWPLPDREEIAGLLDAAIDSLPEDLKASAAPNGQRAAAIDSAVGLTGEEAQACFAKSLVQLKRIDPEMIGKEKRRVIARERVLEWHEPLPGGLDAVGGLENVKAWLLSRSMAYTPAARAYGLPAPKGALLVGIPGTGKSMLAKALATGFKIPLLRLDLGALKSKFVGESEGNLRKALRVVEAIGRCVLWIDEIEKALQGATSGSADGGVSSDALGTLLAWMQERQGEAFVIATANDVSALPPELLRKGRFDEIWFVDLPTTEERVAILKATLRGIGKGAEVDAAVIAGLCEGFTGAEIAAIVPDAMFTAFADGARDISTGDLAAAAGLVVPLSKTAAEKITKLKEWAVGKARPAGRAAQAPNAARPSGRSIDI